MFKYPVLQVYRLTVTLWQPSGNPLGTLWQPSSIYIFPGENIYALMVGKWLQSLGDVGGKEEYGAAPKLSL